MKLSSLFVLLSAFAVQRVWAAQTCDANYGPSGVTECVQLSEYYGYQWATCLTNAYIQQKSNQKHICKYIYATYCWYQCMIEVHDKSDGTVTDDCSCEPGNTTPKPYTGIPTTSLPSKCYSPSGDSCDWYRNCLEKKYPCEDTSNATLSNMLRSFVGYMVTDIPYSVRRDGNGWMLFVSVFKCP